MKTKRHTKNLCERKVFSTVFPTQNDKKSDIACLRKQWYCPQADSYIPTEVGVIFFDNSQKVAE